MALPSISTNPVLNPLYPADQPVDTQNPITNLFTSSRPEETPPQKIQNATDLTANVSEKVSDLKTADSSLQNWVEKAQARIKELRADAQCRVKEANTKKTREMLAVIAASVFLIVSVSLLLSFFIVPVVGGAVVALLLACCGTIIGSVTTPISAKILSMLIDDFKKSQSKAQSAKKNEIEYANIETAIDKNLDYRKFIESLAVNEFYPSEKETIAVSKDIYNAYSKIQKADSEEEKSKLREQAKIDYLPLALDKITLRIKHYDTEVAFLKSKFLQKQIDEKTYNDSYTTLEKEKAIYPASLEKIKDKINQIIQELQEKIRQLHEEGQHAETLCHENQVHQLRNALLPKSWWE